MNDRDDSTPRTPSLAGPAGSTRPQYEAPKITQMDEQQILSAFQMTSASITWWVM